jgi:predicted transglutaminase-like cysteine proteinase
MKRLAALGAILISAAASFSTPAVAADAPTITVTARATPNLFGTVALPTRAGRWAEKWSRVANDSSFPAALRAMIRPAEGLTRIQQLALVQAEVDRRIGWRSDGTAYAERDYWATAGETLSQGFGDDEDRAILKFQALRALGWKAQDMYLVLGRDHVRGAYTMLAARANGRFWLLEDRGSALVPADRRTGFAPMMSFGDNKAWLHGKLRTGLAAPLRPAAVARSVAAR